MRRLFLVRHGETEGQSSIRLNGGATDVPLSDEGREQVRRLGPRLAGEEFAAVVHSPMLRARESAEILIEAMRASPRIVDVEPGFTEVDFGRLEGMTLDEVAAAMPEWYRDWHAGRIDGYPGGETIAAFRERVVAAFGRVLARHPEGDLLVVAHKGVIRYGIQALCRIELAGVRALQMDLGSLWMLRADGDWALELENVVG